MFKLAIISSLVLLSSFNVYAQEKEQIEVWEEPSKSFAITKAIADFEAINDCEIKLREISSAKQLDVLKEHIKNGERIPDVMVTISDKFGEAQGDHLLMPLDFMTIDRKDYLDEAVGAFTESGKIYAAPRSIETLVVYYNADLIQYPAETLAEYEQLAKDNKNNDRLSLIGKFDDIYYAYGFIRGNGGYVFGRNPDGSINVNDIGLDSEGSMKGLAELTEYARNCIPQDIFEKNGDAIIDKLFTSGRAIAVVNGPWALEKYAKAGINIGIAPLPKLKNGRRLAPFFGVKGYTIPAQSLHSELAQKFIQFLNRPEYAEDRYFKKAELPPIKTVLNESFIKYDDLASTLVNEIKFLEPMPNINKMNVVFGDLNYALNRTVLYGIPYKSTFKNAKIRIEQYLYQ